MCGILVWAQLQRDNISQQGPDAQISSDFEHLILRLEEANAARGPDAQNFIRKSAEALDVESSPGSTHRGLQLGFYASELRLRGVQHIVQPHVDVHGKNILCWNGEIFDGLTIGLNENDGSKLFETINSLERPDLLPECFSTVEGPYAFAYYHTSDSIPLSKLLYFARDPLGRRSLLIHRPTVEKPYFILTSVSAGLDSGYDFEELSTDYIYCLDIFKLGRSHSSEGIAAFEGCLTAFPRFEGLSHSSYAAIPSINRNLPPQDLELLNPSENLPTELSLHVAGLITLLQESVRLRVQDIPSNPVGQGIARLAVLFSGGIDCTILAFLAHKYIPIDEPIDLLNVAFDNPRKNQSGIAHASPKKPKVNKEIGRTSNATSEQRSSYAVPDRLTGLQEVKELKRLCPDRIWNFVEVDVSYEESQTNRKAIQDIMLPGNTVMDLSLAIALYFASRGKGQIYKQTNVVPESYQSTARVLLNGLGADELLGGYGRHRSAFSRGGWQALIEELHLDLIRLPTRNLGRDDRIISSHGKEARHPFLSLSVVYFLAKLPVHIKVDPRLEIGTGDKMLLRLAAKKLGLLEASTRKKKAMQFGSHSARMEGGPGDRKGDLLLSAK